MSVYKSLRINGEYHRSKNKKVFAFLKHWTYPFGNYIPFKGSYVPTTYHSHLAWGGVGHYQKEWCISDGLEWWYYTITIWVWIILAIWQLEDEQLKKSHFYNNRGSIGSQTRYHQSDCLRSWGILYSIHYIILRSMLQCGEGEEWKQHSEGVGKCAKKCGDLQNISNFCHITQHTAPGHLQMMSFGFYSLNRLLLCSIPLLTLMEC